MIMTFEQFKYYLDAYGASLRRWPAEIRAEAAAFLASSSAAAGALDEARRLDAVLDRFVVSQERADELRLIDAVVARSTSTPPRKRFDLFAGTASFWPRAAVLAAVAVLGIVTGTFQVERQTYDPASFDVAQTLTSDVAGEVSGL
ncbi:MAG TPA: hypothetical protein VKY65_15340 [Alphaproteobacteria bacterium]|nr:hypothetical protein [Alphaproteobacteria bacterium]